VLIIIGRGPPENCKLFKGYNNLTIQSQVVPLAVHDRTPDRCKLGESSKRTGIAQNPPGEINPIVNDSQRAGGGSDDIVVAYVP
jgi:hypothetical protein